MELISPLLRNDFREFCVTHFVLRHIRDIFDMAGIVTAQLSEHRQGLISGERRTLVEQYYASLNWALTSDADKFLKVIGYAMAQSFLDEKQRAILREMCVREGYIVDGIIVSRPTKGQRVSQSTEVESAPVERKLLFEALKGLFSLAELEHICFLYDLAPYEDLKGATISEKARELIQYCERREALGRLASVIRHERPHSKL